MLFVNKTGLHFANCLNFFQQVFIYCWGESSLERGNKHEEDFFEESKYGLISNRKHIQITLKRTLEIIIIMRHQQDIEVVNGGKKNK